MTEFSLPIRVYIEDTDAGGIVYYANYLKFFERARTEFVRSKGVGLRSKLGEGVSFVVNRVELDYSKPCLLDEELLVTAEVTKVGASYMLFQQKVIGPDSVVRVKGTIRVVCVAYPELTPKRMTKDFRALLLDESN